MSASQVDDEVLDLQDGEDGEQGKRDTYDNDDAFIDDSEYVEYFSGDRHKPKFDGFFINRVSCRSSVCLASALSGVSI